MKFLKKYYPEILVFGFIFAILLVDLNPDFTFMNKGADSIGYAYSAKYLYPSFHTSPPLYLLISHLFLKIPFGTEAWRMAWVSLLSTMGACLFIYLIIRKLVFNRIQEFIQRSSPNNKVLRWAKDENTSRWFALIGVLIYGTSAIVISQSVIIQTYAVVCLFAVGAYYFAISKRWKLAALFLGLGLVVHLLAFFIALIMILAFKEIRKNWKCWAIMICMLAFYVYIPLTNRPPYMWMPDPITVNPMFPKFLVNIYSFIVDTLSTIGFLIGRLSIYDTPKRILDILGVMGVSLGIITIIPIVYYFWKTKFYKNVLFWLILIPIGIFLIELDMNTFDYMMVAMPFLAVVAALGLHKMVENYAQWGKRMAYAVLIVVFGFGCYNAYYFDLGRTLDKNLGASRLYYDEMAKIPDGAIFMPNNTWEWEAIFKYNKDYDKHLIPVAIDILPSTQYLDVLKNQGINLVRGTDPNDTIEARQTAKSIIELNDNVWTTVVTDPSTFSVEVVPANHNGSLIEIYDYDHMRDVAENPRFSWKPYNPYQIIDTSIMITDWRYVLMTKYNISLLILGGAILYLLIYSIIKMNKSSKQVEEV